MEPSLNTAIESKLEHLNKLSKEIEAKITGLIFYEDIEDNPFIVGLNNMIMLKNMANDIYELNKLKEAEIKEKFLTQHGYLKFYAESVYKGQINMHWYEKTLEILIETLKDLNQVDLKKKANAFVILEKVKAMLMLYQYAITFSQEDIFSLDTKHEKWEEIRKFTNRVILAEPIEMFKQIDNFRKGIETAMVLGEVNRTSKNELERTFKMAFEAMTNFLDTKKRTESTIKFRAGMQISKVKAMWNLSESGISKFFVKVLMPSIKYMKKIYLSGRAYPMLTRTAVINWLQGETPKVVLEPAPADQQVTKQNIFLEYQNRICVRVISNVNLERKEKYQGDQLQDFSTVIYHIHGGGFISMTSRTHQTYTRQWANKCGAPVFSVDYRKAPEDPYPRGLADCWQVYNWLVNQSHKFFHIKQKKRIILAGDSAGGNLILGVTNLCIEQGVQLPYAVTAFYPAVNLSLKAFTPSLLFSFGDPLLSFEFLLICIKSYISDPRMVPQKDYLISPIFTPDENLQKFPQIHIFVGERDPLHDDVLRFALRLYHNKTRVNLITYEHMIHAFLSLDVPGGLPSAKKCVQDSIRCLTELVAST